MEAQNRAAPSGKKREGRKVWTVVWKHTVPVFPFMNLTANVNFTANQTKSCWTKFGL